MNCQKPSAPEGETTFYQVAFSKRQVFEVIRNIVLFEDGLDDRKPAVARLNIMIVEDCM